MQNSVVQNNVNHSEMNHDSMMNDNGQMNHAEMKSAPGAQNAPYELQFLDTMTAHHAGAVEMAKIVPSQTKNPELLTFAAKIIADQTTEIAQMKKWREQWFAGKSSAINMEMEGMADSMRGMEMTKLHETRDAAFDQLFLEMMIPHHQGAVVMAKIAQQKAEHQELKDFAKPIETNQSAEIKQMQFWKTKWAK